MSVSGGTRYEFAAPVQGEQAVQGLLPQIKPGERSVQGERSSKLVGEKTHMPQRNNGSAVSCQKWYDGHIEKLLTQGDGTVNEVAVRQAGIAAGYNKNQLYVASSTRRKREARLSVAG